jgi:hypothetical protein
MAEIDRATDLTMSEGVPTTEAYVDLPQEDFEFRAWARTSGLSVKARATPLSSLSAAVTTFLLVVGGCACTLIMAAVGAGGWIATIGLLVPTAIYSGLRHISPK